jgi:2-keto-4-pentenoate hydratase/2-oxohepta-3-ene-1,7-dioic acid hydratase in catechol pathway
MKLATFESGGGSQTGIIVGEEIVSTNFSGSMIDLISRWDELAPEMQIAADSGDRILLSDVKLLAPVKRPGKIFAIGLNYADHIAESGMETPEHQVWFTKAVTSINGPYDPIDVPTRSPYVDYEVELVAVIGKGGRNISAAHAKSHVFGYTVGNDVTERMWQLQTQQWSLGKSFDTHAPIGPWISTADELGDPHALDLKCSVNGEQRQSSNTKHLVFSVWDQIEHLSQAMTLEPGDLIFTGTPSGVGAAMEPRQFLKAGDVLRSEIEKLGVIEATMQSVD